MATSLLETGPKLDWTRDNKIFDRYQIWKEKVELIFSSALEESSAKQKVSYLRYWMGEQGIPLIKKWTALGKLDFSNPVEVPAMQGLSLPFACVGSGDPVRVLRLYTTNTLDIF